MKGQEGHRHLTTALVKVDFLEFLLKRRHLFILHPAVKKHCTGTVHLLYIIGHC